MMKKLRLHHVDITTDGFPVAFYKSKEGVLIKVAYWALASKEWKCYPKKLTDTELSKNYLILGSH